MCLCTPPGSAVPARRPPPPCPISPLHTHTYTHTHTETHTQSRAERGSGRLTGMRTHTLPYTKNCCSHTSHTHWLPGACYLSNNITNGHKLWQIIERKEGEINGGRASERKGEQWRQLAIGRGIWQRSKVGQNKAAAIAFPGRLGACISSTRIRTHRKSRRYWEAEACAGNTAQLISNQPVMRGRALQPGLTVEPTLIIPSMSKNI